MEAAPRLPMISFELKISTENVCFGPTLKQYIASFYHEDPESYNSEIHTLESLRSAAVRPSTDVAGCQLLKRYYSQLSFLKSRFPMGKAQPASVLYSWKDLYAGVVCASADIDFEMSCILYNIGALHTQLGAADPRSTSDGMKMSCTHFQCAAWAFQQLKENYAAQVTLSLAPDVLHFMSQLCLAQAQECILEKSMMDNRKATIIARVAAQVVEYYSQALATLSANGGDDSVVSEVVGSRVSRDWSRYLCFKATYHGCIALLYQGQQAEEQQKMGERVAYYQAASEKLEKARRAAAADQTQSRRHEVEEALAFTQDVVEGKRKAARNENEFIYHEPVPEREALQRVAGASLVKGIPFSVSDADVSGADIFKRLVPMEAHEASSVYSEQKAEMLRQVVALVESKDAELAEFVSSLRLDCLSRWRQASDVPQDVVDRAAALCARPQAIQTLVDAMGRLSGACRDVDSLLADIRGLISEDEHNEREYQSVIGSRPPGIVSTDLSREAAKYAEAHTKANESNEALHRAMSVHVANLRALARPLSELRSTIPCAALAGPDSNVDETAIGELETLVAKVDEMRGQRAGLVAGLREAVRADDITALLVTKPAELTVDQLFQRQLAKHGRQAALIEQNLAAQENILSALTDAYARFGATRRHISELLRKRDATATALVTSYDAYDDLLAKVNKGIEFYQKLEANVSKLLQRVRSACRVNDEERDQMLAKSGGATQPVPAVVPVTTAVAVLPVTTSTASHTPKLKDYLASMKQSEMGSLPWSVTAVRPAPLGSETTGDMPHDASIQRQYVPVMQPTDYYYAGGTYAPHSNYYTPVTTQAHMPAAYYMAPVPVAAPAPAPSPTPPPAPYSYQQQPQAHHSYTTTSVANYMNAMPDISQMQYPYTSAAVANPSSYAHATYSSVSDYSTPDTYSSAYPTAYTQPSYQPYTPTAMPLGTPLTNTSSGSEYAPQYSDQYYPGGNHQQQQQMYQQYQQPQYTNAGISSTYQTDSQSAVPTSTPEHQEPPVLDPAYYYTTPYGYQTPGANPMTMVQANNNNGITSSNTGSSASSAKESTSNVDLLAGLDVSVTQAPLVPQMSAPPIAASGAHIEKQTEGGTSTATTADTPKLSSPAPPPPPPLNTVEEQFSDPLDDPVALDAFTQEVDRFHKFVAGLTTRTLNGPTPLDLKWKEIQERQERDSHGFSISVARCYPMKNRCADILPYDHSRVELPSTKDDYINASHVRAFADRCPPLIVTQAPLASTLVDFWTMVCEQQVEVIVCLLGDAELREAGGAYWPPDKGGQLSVGTKYRVVVRGVNALAHWCERVLAVTESDKPSTTHVLVHLQFTGWPGGGVLPAEPAPLVLLAEAALGCHRQQGACDRPILVHCVAGVGRSGVFCILLAAACNPSGAFDVPGLVARLSCQRKNALRDREHLRFTYGAVLRHGQHVLATKRGLNGASDDLSDRLQDLALADGCDLRKLASGPAIAAMPKTQEIDLSDPLSALDPLWTMKK